MPRKHSSDAFCPFVLMMQCMLVAFCTAENFFLDQNFSCFWVKYFDRQEFWLKKPRDTCDKIKCRLLLRVLKKLVGLMFSGEINDASMFNASSTQHEPTNATQPIFLLFFFDRFLSPILRFFCAWWLNWIRIIQQPVQEEEIRVEEKRRVEEIEGKKVNEITFRELKKENKEVDGK